MIAKGSAKVLSAKHQDEATCSMHHNECEIENNRNWCLNSAAEISSWAGEGI